MRTKALLSMAALAAGALTAAAQSNVYSLNIVGYVNATIAGGGAYSVIANPLINTSPDGNNITNLYATGIADGCSIVRWDPTIPDLSVNIYSYSARAGQWSLNGGSDVSGFDLNPGEGVFFVADPSAPDANITYVGQVVTGSYTNHVLGAGAYNLIASSAPIGGNYTNAIAGMVSADGDSLINWDVTQTDLGLNIQSYSGRTHSWTGATDQNLNIPVGTGFFYISDPSAPDQTWVRTFNP